MTEVIGILSGKGGVGKSTLAFNLSTALAEQSVRVLLIDADLSTPALGLIVNSPLNEHGLQDVLTGQKSIRDITYRHPEGPFLIFSHLNKKAKLDTLRECLDDLYGTVDYVLLDGPSGITPELRDFIHACDSILIVTHPDQVSATHALSMLELVREEGTRLKGIVVNAVQHESPFTPVEISSLLGATQVHTVRYDPLCLEALKQHQSVFAKHRHGSSAGDYREIAAWLREKKR